MPDLIIHLDLRADQMLQYYRGTVRAVQARATNGQVVQLPVNVLQRHITKDGVRGLFRLEFDANNKFVRIERLETR